MRSGQQIYAESSSLTVVGTVNSGGEVLADGDIHVYGALNGRALAGLGGSSSSSTSESASNNNMNSSTSTDFGSTPKIFTSSFGASLVGIGDEFVIPDDFPQLSAVIGKHVCIYMSKGVGKDKGSHFSNSNNVEKEIEIECASGNKMIFAVLS